MSQSISNQAAATTGTAEPSTSHLPPPPTTLPETSGPLPPSPLKPQLTDAAPSQVTVHSGPGRPKRPRNNIKYSPARTGKSSGRRIAASTATSSIRPLSGGEVLNASGESCAACGAAGLYVCCDGCPRVFHPLCLEPPLSGVEEAGEHWYCRECQVNQGRFSPVPSTSNLLFSKLLEQQSTENPRAFKLPEELRTQYEHVSTNPYTGDFVDQSRIKNKKRLEGTKGYLEEPDPYRIKTKDGRTILCYNCGMGASAAKRLRIIGCDICDHFFHLDCLDPPLVTAPPMSIKWVCPLHLEKAAPNRRVPKETVVIPITKLRVPNNGDIDIIPPPPKRTRPNKVEEISINRVRYQVPENIIILDFWAKLGRNKETQRPKGRTRESSPLTSLSSRVGSPQLPILGRDILPPSAATSECSVSASTSPSKSKVRAANGLGRDIEGDASRPSSPAYSIQSQTQSPVFVASKPSDGTAQVSRPDISCLLQAARETSDQNRPLNNSGLDLLGDAAAFQDPIAMSIESQVAPNKRPRTRSKMPLREPTSATSRRTRTRGSTRLSNPTGSPALADTRTRPDLPDQLENEPKLIEMKSNQVLDTPSKPPTLPSGQQQSEKVTKSAIPSQPNMSIHPDVFKVTSQPASLGTVPHKRRKKPRTATTEIPPALKSKTQPQILPTSPKKNLASAAQEDLQVDSTNVDETLQAMPHPCGPLEQKSNLASPATGPPQQPQPAAAGLTPPDFAQESESSASKATTTVRLKVSSASPASGPSKLDTPGTVPLHTSNVPSSEIIQPAVALKTRVRKRTSGIKDGHITKASSSVRLVSPQVSASLPQTGAALSSAMEISPFYAPQTASNGPLGAKTLISQTSCPVTARPSTPQTGLNQGEIDPSPSEAGSVSRPKKKVRRVKTSTSGPASASKLGEKNPSAPTPSVNAVAGNISGISTSLLAPTTTKTKPSDRAISPQQTAGPCNSANKNSENILDDGLGKQAPLSVQALNASVPTQDLVLPDPSLKPSKVDPSRALDWASTMRVTQQTGLSGTITKKKRAKKSPSNSDSKTSGPSDVSASTSASRVESAKIPSNDLADTLKTKHGKRVANGSHPNPAGFTVGHNQPAGNRPKKSSTSKTPSALQISNQASSTKASDLSKLLNAGGSTPKAAAGGQPDSKISLEKSRQASLPAPDPSGRPNKTDSAPAQSSPNVAPRKKKVKKKSNLGSEKASTTGPGSPCGGGNWAKKSLMPPSQASISNSTSQPSVSPSQPLLQQNPPATFVLHPQNSTSVISSQSLPFVPHPQQLVGFVPHPQHGLSSIGASHPLPFVAHPQYPISMMKPANQPGLHQLVQNPVFHPSASTSRIQQARRPSVSINGASSSNSPPTTTGSNNPPVSTNASHESRMASSEAGGRHASTTTTNITQPNDNHFIPLPLTQPVRTASQ